MTKQWKEVQRHIQRLYITERRTLREVQQALAAEHGFRASTRALQMKFDEWGYTKYKTKKKRNILRVQAKEISAQHDGQIPLIHHDDPTLVVEAFQPFDETDRPVDLAEALQPHSSGTSQTAHSSVGDDHTSRDLASRDLVNRDLVNRDTRPHSNLGSTGAISRTPLTVAVEGNEALCQSAQRKDLTALKKWLRRGVHPDSRNKDGDYAIHLVVKLQLSEGRNPAYEHAAIICTKTLLSHGASVGSRDSIGSTALHYAAWSPHLVAILLEHKAPVNASNLVGEIPLHMAIYHGPGQSPAYLASVHRLLDAGSDVNFRSEKGTSPFHLALQSFRQMPGRMPVRSFLDHGADLTVSLGSACSFQEPFRFLIDMYDSIPRRRLSEWERAISKCLDRGADPNARLQNGYTLFHQTLMHLQSDGRNSESTIHLGKKLCGRVGLGQRDNFLGLWSSDPMKYPLMETPLNIILSAMRSLERPSEHSMSKCLSVMLARATTKTEDRREILRDLRQYHNKYLDTILLWILQKTPEATDADAVDALLSAGANPWLNECRCIELAVHGLTQDPYRQQMIQKLLHFMAIQDTPQIVVNGSPISSTLKAWILEWRTKMSERIWFHVRFEDTVLAKDQNISEKVELFQIMMKMLAEKILSSGCWTNEYATILQDCESLGVKLDPKWTKWLFATLTSKDTLGIFVMPMTSTRAPSTTLSSP